MHFVVNIILLLFLQYSLVLPQPVSKDAVEIFDAKLLYSLRFLALFLHCCQSLLYSCTFSVCLISGRSIKSSGILSPDGTMSDLTSSPDHEELTVALVLIFVVVRYVIHFGLTRVSYLHASASWLIRIQSEFNPHSEMGCLIRISI